MTSDGATAVPSRSETYPYNGRMTKWDEVAPGLAILSVEPLAGSFPFEPGQYATLGLLNPAGKLVQRPMSIASSAERLGDYEFLIRLVEEGAFTPLLWEIKAGDPIHIKGPKGRFVLQDDGRKCLFVASGTGLAPFWSMIQTLRDRGQEREMVLLHGVSRDVDLAWRREMEEIEAAGYPLRYVGTVSRPQHCPDWRGCTGRVETIFLAQLAENGLDATNTTIYLCGNPDMVAAIETLAAAHGFPPAQVRKELYWTVKSSGK